MSLFAFLQAEFSPVYEAESVTVSDPRAACFYARLALETAVKWMYERDKALRTPYDEALSALIHEPSFRAVAGDARVTKARIIKDLGNRAVHDTRVVAPQSATIALRELFHFSYWLVRTYAKGTKPDAGLQFSVEALPRTAQVESTTLARLQEIAKRFADQPKPYAPKPRPNGSRSKLRTPDFAPKSALLNRQTRPLLIITTTMRLRPATPLSISSCTRLGGRSIRPATANSGHRNAERNR